MSSLVSPAEDEPKVETNGSFSSRLVEKKRIPTKNLSFEPIAEEPSACEVPPEPIIKVEDDETPSAFVRPVIRRNKPKAVRPLSESIDYNADLVEKLEAPTLRRVLSLGPEERFKRSSLR